MILILNFTAAEVELHISWYDREGQLIGLDRYRVTNPLDMAVTLSQVPLIGRRTQARLQLTVNGEVISTVRVGASELEQGWNQILDQLEIQ